MKTQKIAWLCHLICVVKVLNYYFTQHYIC